MSLSCPAQVNSCDSDDELELLVELIGTLFFRAPMLLFVWGSLIVFLEFVLYFKIHVDAGFNCSMCLASCFVLVPLFVHCMHKMGWAAAVVHAESASRRRRAAERPCAPAELKGAFLDYAAATPVLSLDKGELRKFAEDRLGVLTTTAQHAFLDKLFDRYVDARLDDLASDAATPPESAVARFHDIEKLTVVETRAAPASADDAACHACAY